MTKHTFRAYDIRGRFVVSTWTRAPSTYAYQCAAFQSQLNRGELSRVDVWSSDPHEPARSLLPRSRPHLSVVQ
jgi:hypothetical protein